MKSGKSESEKEKKEGGQNIGFQFNQQVSGENQTFINGNVDNLNINRGLSVDQLKQLDILFQPLKEQVQVESQEKQKMVDEKVQELHDELSKGQEANAGRLNKIVDALADMVPGAISAVTSMFATPVLGALVGPATKLVLDHIRK